MTANRLTRARVLALTTALEKLAQQPLSRLVISGNAHFFSVGADLNEIARLHGPEVFRFAEMGQRLMHVVATFPAPTIAAIHGYCMGGGLTWRWHVNDASQDHTPSSDTVAPPSDLSPAGVAHSACRASSAKHAPSRCFSPPKKSTPPTRCATD